MVNGHHNLHPPNSALGVHKVCVADKRVVEIHGRAEIVAPAEVRKRGRVQVLGRSLPETPANGRLHELHVPVLDDVDREHLNLATGRRCGRERLSEGVSPRREHVEPKVLEGREHEREFAAGDELLEVGAAAVQSLERERRHKLGLADIDELLGADGDLAVRIVELLKLGEHVGPVLLDHLLLCLLDHDVQRVHHVTQVLHGRRQPRLGRGARRL